MRTFLLPIAVIVAIVAIALCGIAANENIAPTEGTRVYDADYIKEYGSTLNAMFDDSWRLVTAAEKYEEHELVCAHVDTRPQRFTEWTIEYQDGNGETKTFVFDNRQELSTQIKTYVTDLISAYYEENFLFAYFKDAPLAPATYVFGFFVENRINPFDDDKKDMEDKTNQYQSGLQTPENTICLSRLTAANAFEMCPVYLSINVSFGEYTGDKEAFEKKAMSQMEDMIVEMNAFTKNHLTAEISMGYQDGTYLHTRTSEKSWAYVQGIAIPVGGYGDYERDAFEGYKGKFW